MKYVHTNIIAKDWKLLSDFYINVFDCKPVLPERNLKGDWLEKGTAVKDASLQGVHLLLPGFGEDGPTLEIFQYQENEGKPECVANREGFGHIAFSVDNVEVGLKKMISAGGSKLGEIVKKDFGKGTLIFTYAKDPEGNIIELQTWKFKN
ncbi:MAG: VOC family protein [Candidatus Jacksonbacteria bacterium]|jgi:predicted enzyme related to lactoylglutathione lyase|nr:VOC family protein [Candidatus Jacksonbacteria bacterium]